MTEGPESQEKKNWVSNPFKFRQKNHNKKSLEGKFQKKIQTAVSGTKNTVETDTGKIISRKFISGPLFQTQREARREPAPITNGEIYPKNRHCLRGLDGKCGRWDEIFRDILNGKLKIVQNWKRSDSEMEDEEDVDEEEEMPEMTRNATYDTSERNGKYVLIQTNPEEDVIQIHTDCGIPGENFEHNIRRSNRTINKPNIFGSIPYTRSFGDKEKINFIYYRCLVEQKQRNALTGNDPKAGRFPPRRFRSDTTPTIYFRIEDPLRIDQETDKMREGKMLYGSSVE